MCREGNTWSVQLSYKVQPVKTHENYAIFKVFALCKKGIANLNKDTWNSKHFKASSFKRCQLITWWIYFFILVQIRSADREWSVV